MTTPNDFSEYYKTISNTELLSILENPADYQPSAIEAAKKEFAERQLSDIEIKEAKEPLIDKQIQKEKQKEKIKAIEDKVRSTGYTLFETLNPIQSEISSTEKIIRYIVIVFGGLFLYQFIKDFRSNIEFAKDIPGYPFESALYFLPLLLLPVAVFTFWRKKRIGWMLLTIFLTFSGVATIWVLIQALLWKPSGNSLFDTLSAKPPVLTLIVQIIFFIGTLYAICKQNIREVFSITENKMVTVLSITGVLTFLIVYASS